MEKDVITQEQKPNSLLAKLQKSAAAQSSHNIAQSNVTESELPIKDIKKNPYQPRKYFDEAKLKIMAQSIEKHGLIHPISVAVIDGEYYLIAGERRLRGHEIAAIDTIKVNLRYDITEDQLRELALIENIHRDDLSIMEEAISYKALNEEFDKSYREISELTGRSKTTIGDIVKFTTFDEKSQELLLKNKINNTAILNVIIKCPQTIHLQLIKKLVDNNLSLNEARQELTLSQNLTNAAPKKEKVEKSSEYPYELTKIKGVEIEDKKKILNVQIDKKDFDVNDSKALERYIKMIIERIREDSSNV